MPFRRFFTFVAGSDAEFTLEHRIFNTSSFFITTFAVIGATANYLIGLPAPTVWLSLIGAMVSAILYNRSRFGRRFSVIGTFGYVFATVALLGSMHFYNAASQGTVFYLIIMLLNVFLLIVPTRYQYSVYGILYSTLLVLLVLEYYFPEWIVPYTTREEQILDHIITLLYSTFYTTLIILTVRKNYNREREKVEAQNQQLVLLNEQINEQRQALEAKTVALEASVQLANERHENINMLLQELNHRVKNNLQVVSSLLNLQAHSINDTKAKNAILESKNRLLSMVLIHQRLYHHQNATQVHMPEYLQELAENIQHTYSGPEEEAIILYEVDDVWLNVEKAIPVGLISNELITNCFKHVITKKPDGHMHVKLKQKSQGYRLVIADNGSGFAENVKARSFGLEIVKSLVKQLGGTYQISFETGTCWEIDFE